MTVYNICWRLAKCQASYLYCTWNICLSFTGCKFKSYTHFAEEKRSVSFWESTSWIIIRRLTRINSLFFLITEFLSASCTRKLLKWLQIHKSKESTKISRIRSANSEDTRSTLKNLLYFYIVAINTWRQIKNNMSNYSKSIEMC